MSSKVARQSRSKGLIFWLTSVFSEYTVTQKFTGTIVDHVTIFKAGGDRWQVKEIKVTAGEGEEATFDCKDTKMEFSSPMLTCDKA